MWGVFRGLKKIGVKNNGPTLLLLLFVFHTLYIHTYILSLTCVRALLKGRHEEDAYHHQHHHHQQHQQQQHQSLCCARGGFVCREETGVVATNSSSSSSPFCEKKKKKKKKKAFQSSFARSQHDDDGGGGDAGDVRDWKREETGRGETHPRLFVFRVVFVPLDCAHRLSSSRPSGIARRPERYRDREVSVGVERDTRADARGRHEFMLQRAERITGAVREMVLRENGFGWVK